MQVFTISGDILQVAAGRNFNVGDCFARYRLPTHILVWGKGTVTPPHPQQI